MPNPPQPPSPGPTQGIDSGLRWSLRALAVGCIVVAGLHLGKKVEVDTPVLYLIGIAFGALAFPDIGKLSFGKDGLNIERYQELKSSLEQVKAGTSELATAVENRIGGPSPASAEGASGIADVAAADLQREPLDVIADA